MDRGGAHRPGWALQADVTCAWHHAARGWVVTSRYGLACARFPRRAPCHNHLPTRTPTAARLVPARGLTVWSGLAPVDTRLTWQLCWALGAHSQAQPLPCQVWGGLQAADVQAGTQMLMHVHAGGGAAVRWVRRTDERTVPASTEREECGVVQAAECYARRERDAEMKQMGWAVLPAQLRGGQARLFR
jgi:hypothetical protein